MDFTWQDREIRFDGDKYTTSLRTSEEVVQELSDVEDCKGSNNEAGRLLVTNLRIIWIFKMNSKTNLSVGYDTIRRLAFQDPNPSFIDPRAVLNLSAKYNDGRFEFIFACANPRASKVFRVLAELQKSYAATRLFRDLKLRGGFIKNKQLTLLPGETMVRKLQGVFNLSADQGNLGTFFVTNVRVVWFAEMAENFNISIPYIQITKIVMKKSAKFGKALVLQTNSFSGNYTLGFSIDPEAMLYTLHQELTTLYEVYAKKPNFGVKYTPRKRRHSEEKGLAAKEDDVRIVTTSQMEHFDTLTRYYADPGKGTDRKPVYDEHLGLAVEGMSGDMSTDKLWVVVA